MQLLQKTHVIILCRSTDQAKFISGLKMLSKLDLISRIVSKSQINVAIKSAFAAPAKVAGGQAVGKKRFRLPVEQDVSKLMANCCGANYRKDGEEIKLKDDSEYPEWLWKMPLKPRRLEEYDPATKEYWERAEVVGRQREYKLKSLAPVSFISFHFYFGI